jgi:hypothetical protein
MRVNFTPIAFEEQSIQVESQFEIAGPPPESGGVARRAGVVPKR